MTTAAYVLGTVQVVVLYGVLVGLYLTVNRDAADMAAARPEPWEHPVYGTYRPLGLPRFTITAERTFGGHSFRHGWRASIYVEEHSGLRRRCASFFHPGHGPAAIAAVIEEAHRWLDAHPDPAAAGEEAE